MLTIDSLYAIFILQIITKVGAMMTRHELIDRAIESARCRIYRLKANTPSSCTKEHQIKASNQIELMNITIEALEKLKLCEDDGR